MKRRQLPATTLINIFCECVSMLLPPFFLCCFTNKISISFHQCVCVCVCFCVLVYMNANSELIYFSMLCHWMLNSELAFLCVTLNRTAPIFSPFHFPVSASIRNATLNNSRNRYMLYEYIKHRKWDCSTSTAIHQRWKGHKHNIM